MRTLTFTIFGLIGLMIQGATGQGFENNTTLTIESGATLYVDTDLKNNSGATLSNAGEIRVSGDFDNSGTETINELVVLNGSGAQAVTGTSKFYGVLEVNKSGGTATVSSGTTNIHGQLRLAEGTMDANGNVVIASTATETGLVDDFSDGSYDGTLSGNIRVQRHLTGAVAYHYIGSAVNTANVSELSEIGLYGPNNGQIIPEPDCNPYWVAGNSPFGALFEWREAGPWTVANCLLSGWYVRSNGTMTNGRGYAALVGAGTLEIGGSTANTSESTTISLNSLENSNATGNGWQLVSNPFPSPIQWYTPPSGFDSQAHFWQASGQYTGTYQPVLAHATNPAALIGSSQAFFVRVSSGTANFSLPQDYRRLGDPSFYKEDLSNTFDVIVKTGDFADKTRVRFADEADVTNGFDSMKDANKLMAKGAQPTLMTRTRGVNYSINALSLADHPMTIAMDLYPGVSGEFEFTAEHLDLFTVEAHVYLEDLKLDKIQELTVNPVYTFEADEADDPERFLLHFRLDEDEEIYTGENILMYANDGNAVVFIPELDGKSELNVFNALGDLVYQSTQLSEGKNTFDLNHLATGSYILRAVINNEPVTRKVIL